MVDGLMRPPGIAMRTAKHLAEQEAWQSTLTLQTLSSALSEAKKEAKNKL